MSIALRKPATAEERSPEQTAYDSAKYAHIVDWTHSSLLIRGKPVQLISAEFQYFRVPDRERWRPLLIDIKGMGFNAVRLYIHWGYHCPAEGVYNFRGNRDIEYLLALCVELRLFVIVAPGPYICAEVQAGGFPIWLVAKRNMRVRHMAMAPFGLVKKWDQAWHDYCDQYMRKILPMLVNWELTTNPDGCIIALQIENELREPPMIGFGGMDDEIRLLCETAREMGSTVPFFHNDDSPLGSWSAGGEYRSLSRAGMKTGQKAYRTDLYGFDLYITFPPGDRSGDLSSMQVGMIEACGVSACLNCCGIGGAGVGGSDSQCLSCLYDAGTRHAPPPSLGWADAKQMEKFVDVLGDMMYKFGGSARHAPSIVAEAQVGWINQWGRMRTYDDVYNFFGDDFSATLQNSLMAQGINVVNHYIAYGGTNHGTVGDTEVYSSYDYSAFIREFGLLSRRGRVLRESMLFARSFSDLGFSNTSFAEKSSQKKSKAIRNIKTTNPDALVAVREAVDVESCPCPVKGHGDKPRTYAFLRNLREDNLRFNLIVENIVIPSQLAKCESFIAPVYHPLENCGLSVLACTVPVICRARYQGAELWVLRVRHKELGRMVFRVDRNQEVGSRGLVMKWASIEAEEDPSENLRLQGELRATDQDPGAATSLLSGPLEELPLTSQGSLAVGDMPFGLKASTEGHSFCYSISFSGREPTVAILSDLGERDGKLPALQLLCLPPADADTFSANLGANDVFKEDGKEKAFAAAWGVSNLAFLDSGMIEVGFVPRDCGATLFTLQDQPTNSPPEPFQRVNGDVSALFSGLSKYQVPPNALSAAVKQSVEEGDPLSKNFEIPIENWSQRSIDWADDVVWKSINYENRDPLDQFMTSGHVTYRMRFRSSSKSGAIITNVRHSAVVWCNKKAVGGQVCFSHNVMSAGAMHAIDIPHAGKKRHDISAGLQSGPDANGFHEVVILVLSMGQSRSPFLLNDVRNKRGLLSARLSRRMSVSDVSWDIAGVDVTKTDDAYGSSGLPCEDEANTVSYEAGFEASGKPSLSANDGVVYYRGTFRVPANSVVHGSVRYPLRLKVDSGRGVRMMIWVNTLFLGRYVEPLGPQNDFYIPEGLIKQFKGNSVVLAVYGPVDTSITVRLLPWVVSPSSGNRDDENGEVFALRLASFNLNSEKKS